MKRVVLNVAFMLSVLFFSGCSPSPKEAFKTLTQIEGQWKSTGRVIVYENWTLENDSLLTGYQFAKRGENKLVLERYRLERKGEQILFAILQADKTKGEYQYPLAKSMFGSFNFENPDAVYPNRILIDFENDSTFTKRKENTRGKKGIEFEMKKWKE